MRGSHRISPPSSALRGRIVVAAVAVGAFAAASAGQSLHSGSSSDEVTPLAGSRDATAAIGMGGAESATFGSPELLPAARATLSNSNEAAKLADSERVSAARIAKVKAAEEAARPKYIRPADGAFTSGFGGRWGTTHFGIDIANRIGTPIRAVTDGVVVEAGTASGFGLWVRVQHEDGTISVYGHVDTFSVHEGQKVKAGEQIARMGNRGHSTGPHLHFEVWSSTGKKMNPAPWLAAHGIKL